MGSEVTWQKNRQKGDFCLNLHTFKKVVFHGHLVPNFSALY